ARQDRLRRHPRHQRPPADGQGHRGTRQAEVTRRRETGRIVMSEKLTIEMSRYCVPFTPFRGPLEEASVMLVSTAGVHHMDDPPFDTDGDTSFRVIPGDATAADLRVADTHYDHGCIDKDVN